MGATRWPWHCLKPVVEKWLAYDPDPGGLLDRISGQIAVYRILDYSQIYLQSGLKSASQGRSQCHVEMPARFFIRYMPSPSAFYTDNASANRFH